MSNWCANVLTTENKVLLDEFRRIEKLCMETQLGQQLFDKGMYLFEIILVSDNTILYDTKWNPNIDDLILFSKQHEFDFMLSYEELGNEIYGELKCLNGEIFSRELNDDDFESVEHDEESDLYTFGSETRSDVEEFYDRILNTKEWKLLN